MVVPEDLAKAVDLFKGDLPHAVMFNTEYDSALVLSTQIDPHQAFWQFLRLPQTAS